MDYRSLADDGRRSLPTELKLNLGDEGDDVDVEDADEVEDAEEGEVVRFGRGMLGRDESLGRRVWRHDEQTWRQKCADMV